MARKLVKGIWAVLPALCLALCIHASAVAHGDEPRLELSAERFNPGAVLDVRGVSFEPEEEITLALVSGQMEVFLGTVKADVDGEFTETILLPSNLVEGIYTLRARVYDHATDSPSFTVWGPAVSGDEEGGGQREQAEGLLQPVPGDLPISSPAPARVETPPSGSRSEQTIPLFMVAAIVLCGAGIVSGWRWLKKG